MAKAKRVRGSKWFHPCKKRGYGLSIGAYNVKRGDRHFILTVISSGKTRVYESPEAARADGWRKCR